MNTTVIMNTFKEDKNYLKEAIDSYINQTFPVELIVSTIEGDWSIDFIKNNYLDKVRVVEFSKNKHPNKSPIGSYLQLNNAIPFINGDWFCFASSNDIAELNKIEQEVLACVQHNKHICYSDFNEISEDGQYVLTRKFHPYSHEKHLEGNFVSDCALMSRRLVEKYLPFRLEMKNYAYWDLWLRIYEGEGDVFAYLSHATWNYRRCSDSMHTTRTEQQQRQHEIDKQYMLSTHENNKVHNS